eukprot:628790-Alexandrium_andersonii.AAC.1
MGKPSRDDGYEFGERVSTACASRTWTAASTAGGSPACGWGVDGAWQPTSWPWVRERCARCVRSRVALSESA